MQKVVIITGASRGIGAATAKLLAKQGYAVCVNYRAQAEAAAQVVREIEEVGGKAIAIKADVRAGALWDDQLMTLLPSTQCVSFNPTQLL